MWSIASAVATLAVVAVAATARADGDGAPSVPPSARPTTAAPSNPSSTTTTDAPPAAEPPPGGPASEPAGGAPSPAVDPVVTVPRADVPAPLQVDYVQYGLAIGGDFDLASGPICPSNEVTPCIIGSGGGLTLRGGYRPSGPWFIGGAYQFSKLDSNNLFRLGVFQMIRAEMRYYFDLDSPVAPFIEWGLGPCIYGNLFGADTGGAAARAGGGVAFEVSRFVAVGASLTYQPTLLVGYTDTTNQRRDTGVTQFLHLEFTIELRTEVGRE